MASDSDQIAPPGGEASPFDDGRLYDALFGGLRYDVEFYLGLARQAPGPVLEVACGTGRILVPLLEAGVEADGLDLYPSMLQVLRNKIRDMGRKPNLYLADMRSFSLPRRYRWIFIPFNGFLHNLTAGDQLSTLRTCRAHLTGGGGLVMEIFFPGLEVIAGPEGVPVLEHEVRDKGSGGQIRIFDTRRLDRVEQVQRSEIEIQELDAENRLVASHCSRTQIRWIYRWEAELLFRAAGFSRWEIHGSFDGRPLTRETETMICYAFRD
jgi:SAM-dependent methyltransferase